MPNSKNEVLTKPVNKKASDVAGFLRQYKKAKPISVEEMSWQVGQYLAGDKQ